jgi:hypothetical protein
VRKGGKAVTQTPVPPSPLTRGQRRAIEEAARTDARHRIPEPFGATVLVTTAWREAVWDERDEFIANLHVELEEMATRVEQEIAQLIDAVKAAANRRNEALHALEGHCGQPPTSERRFGEERTPDKIVEARRQREHFAREQALRTMLESREAELTELDGKKTALDVKLERLRKHFATRAHQRHVQAQAMRRIYDQALLRHHPLRRELQGALDQEPRPLPTWVLEHMEPEGPQR